MNFLVTGGCGFIRTQLVGRLFAEDEHRVTVLDDLSVGTRRDLELVCDVVDVNPDRDTGGGCSLAAGVRLVVGNVLDRELALRLAREADVIVHLAAETGVAPSLENPRRDCETNVLGTLNLLEAARARNVGRFVFASSGAPLGECEPPIHEEVAPHPVSPYGASKLAGEGYCSAYFRSFGLETVALRFGNVYGPGSGRKESVVARFVKRALAGEPLVIYGDGGQTRDFIFCDDLVRAILRAATLPGIGGETFQIASASETSVAELARTLVAVLEEVGVRDVVLTGEKARAGDVLRSFSDTSKAARVLGWRPEVSLEDGLRRTVEWFAKRARP